LKNPSEHNLPGVFFFKLLYILVNILIFFNKLNKQFILLVKYFQVTYISILFSHGVDDESSFLAKSCHSVQAA
jgi:type IV secretory pathway TrbL component